MDRGVPKDQLAGDMENVVKEPGLTRSWAQGHLVSEHQTDSSDLPLSGGSPWRYPGCGADRTQGR